MGRNECKDCERYRKAGHNYCRKCGERLRPGQNVRVASAYSTDEKFCGYCGKERNRECKC